MKIYERDGGRTIHDTSQIPDDVWDRMRQARADAENEADTFGRPAPAGSAARPVASIPRERGVCRNCGGGIAYAISGGYGGWRHEARTDCERPAPAAP